MTELSDLPIRDSLKGRTPYGAPQLHVPIALNVNENSHRIPEEVAIDVVSRLAQAVLNINRYPDREFTTLREKLADYLGHDLTAEQLWAANGSNEVIQQIFQAFGGPGRKALGFKPTYSMYSLIALGADTDYFEVDRADRYELTPELIREGMARELVNRIQNMRKEAGFEVTDRIDVKIDTTEAIMHSIKQFETYICQEVLANHILFTTLSSGQKETIEAEGDTLFNITKSN